MITKELKENFDVDETTINLILDPNLKTKMEDMADWVKTEYSGYKS